MQFLEVLSALSNVATAFGVGVAAYQLLITRKQRVTTFEDSLSAQYRQVASALPVNALLGESLTNEEHDAHLKHFYRYFDLCNEQVFLHKSGRISKSTWDFWKDGILTNLRRPAFATAWQEIASKANDDFSELRLLSQPDERHAHPNAGAVSHKQ